MNGEHIDSQLDKTGGSAIQDAETITALDWYVSNNTIRASLKTKTLKQVFNQNKTLLIKKMEHSSYTYISEILTKNPLKERFLRKPLTEDNTDWKNINIITNQQKQQSQVKTLITLEKAIETWNRETNNAKKESKARQIISYPPIVIDQLSIDNKRRKPSSSDYEHPNLLQQPKFINILWSQPTTEITPVNTKEPVTTDATEGSTTNQTATTRAANEPATSRATTTNVAQEPTMEQPKDGSHSAQQCYHAHGTWLS